MNYDIEREKQKTTEIRNAMRECFPLCNEDDLPSAASQIKGFLRDRIQREVEEGVFNWQSQIVRVLCEVSPPKSHAVDMARFVVEQAKESASLAATIRKAEEEIRRLKGKA